MQKTYFLCQQLLLIVLNKIIGLVVHAILVQTVDIASFVTINHLHIIHAFIILIVTHASHSSYHDVNSEKILF